MPETVSGFFAIDQTSIMLRSILMPHDLPQFRTKKGWTLFELPAGSPPLTGETLEEWEKAEHEEEHRLAFSPRR